MSIDIASNEETEYRRALHENLVSQEPLLRRASIVLSLMIAIASFFGLRDIVEGDGWDAKVIPAVAAVGGGVLFWVAWHKLFSTLHLMDSGVRRVQLILIAALVTLVQMAFSAWPVATTISGKNAITVHLSKFTNAAREVLGDTYQTTLLQSGLVGKTQAAAVAIRQQATFESETGISTGMKGEGLVAKNMKELATTFDRTSSQMSDAIKLADRQNETGREVLRDMDRIVADGSIKSSDRQRQFASLVSQFTDVVHSLARTDITGYLDSIIVRPAQRIGTPKQIAAAADMQTTMQKFVDDLGKQAKPLKKTEFLRPPVFAPLSPGMAVLAYATELPMGWGIALGLDLLPFLLLIGTMIAWLDNRLPPHKPHPFNQAELPSTRPPSTSGRPPVRVVGE